jgi:hypothetical protein
MELRSRDWLVGYLEREVVTSELHFWAWSAAVELAGEVMC